MTCMICCENFNRSNHIKRICPFNNCNFESCKMCIRTYILNTTNEPHCMNCKNPYNQDFLIEKLNKSFIENDYKKHRKSLLVEREISKTQELMPLVGKQIEIEEHTKLMNEDINKRKEILASLRKIDEQIKMKAKTIRNLNNCDIENERKQFIMPCPADNCKGYLSNKYKCGICKLYTCPDCFEVIGYTQNQEHICNPDSVKSAEAIKRETKPCPKCGVRIFKITGCDQMWCTECKVTFSWNTGKTIITNTIHNPHFVEYMRKQNNGDTRNPGDVLCGGLINWTAIMAVVRCITGTNIKDIKYMLENVNKKYNGTIYANNNIVSGLLQSIFRIMTHFNQIDLVRIRQAVVRLTNHDEKTIKYIRNLITKDELATAIIRDDNSKRKSNQILHVYELVSIVSIEGFNSIYSKYQKCRKNKHINSSDFYDLYSECVKFIEQFNYIINYSNIQLANISYNYSLSVLQFGIYYKLHDTTIKEGSMIDSYRIIKMRFNKNDIMSLENSNKDFKYLETISHAGPSSIN